MATERTGPMKAAVAMLSVALGLTVALALVTGVAEAENQTSPALIERLRQNLQAQAAGPEAAAAPATAPTAPGRPGKLRYSADDDRITLHVEDVDIRVVLELLSRKSQINIMPSTGVTGNVSANLYNVTLEQALEAILRANKFTPVREGDVIYVYTDSELKELFATRQPLIQKLYKPSFVRASELERLIKPHLSERGKVTVTTASAKGISASSDAAGGDDLATEDVILICDIEPCVKAAMDIIRQTDVRPKQVLIEITMLTVQLNESNHLGVQFETLTGWKHADNAATFTDLSSISHGTNTLANYDNSLGRFATQGFASGTGAGLKIGYVDGSVHLFLEALESVGDTDVLASPRIVVLNKQKAEIVIGQRLGFRTRTATETSTVEQVEFMDVGTQLRVRPWISSTGDIRLEIHPERSTGQINPDTELPEKSTTEVTTNVLVRDGQTIVIGGLMEDRNTKTVEKVPLLGDIPGLGTLFQRTIEKKTKTELLIFMTPHVASEPDQLKGMSDDERAGAKVIHEAVEPGAFDEHLRGLQRGAATQPATGSAGPGPADDEDDPEPAEGDADEIRR